MVMETITLNKTATAITFKEPLQPGYSNIKDYYTIAGPDYAAWSKHLNMHFGYCKKFTDIFFLEKMLYRMNDEVLKRLQIPVDKKTTVVDLGCGVGTVARYTAKQYPLTTIKLLPQNKLPLEPAASSIIFSDSSFPRYLSIAV